MDLTGNHMPRMGEPAPAFEAETTRGRVRFPDDYRGKWVIFFSTPSDFTPVCTTELMRFASKQQEFRKLKCELLALSIDTVANHEAWLRAIREKIEFCGCKGLEIEFPVVSDPAMEVARQYGMLQKTATSVAAVRSVFIIDPQSKVRTVLYYPLSNGRNVEEIRRLLVALQTSDMYKVVTPADWVPGMDVAVPPPKDGRETMDYWSDCFVELDLD